MIRKSAETTESDRVLDTLRDHCGLGQKGEQIWRYSVGMYGQIIYK